MLESPIVLGHESSGTVVEVGRAVKNLRQGDRVAIEPGVPCRRCDYCRGGGECFDNLRLIKQEFNGSQNTTCATIPSLQLHRLGMVSIVEGSTRAEDKLITSRNSCKVLYGSQRLLLQDP